MARETEKEIERTARPIACRLKPDTWAGINISQKVKVVYHTGKYTCIHSPVHRFSSKGTVDFNY